MIRAVIFAGIVGGVIDLAVSLERRRWTGKPTPVRHLAHWVVACVLVTLAVQFGIEVACL